MSDDTPKFSVLMAIYIKDSPLFLSGDAANLLI